MRSHHCGNLNIKNLNQEVTICGWIHRRRDHGGVIFLDVRDTTGIVQVVVNPENLEAFKIAEDLRSEYVIKAFGKVEGRPEDSQNDQLTTGDIEIKCSSIELLNEAETPAFPLDQSSEVGEDVRLKNRTLDLRRPEMQKNLRLKSSLTKSIRDYLESNNFVDIETDMETGHSKILRYTVFQDAGKAIHPSYVEGQMQGGSVQGIGWALNEEYIYNSDGRLQNPGFLDYRIPVASDLPMIDPVILEIPNPGHPYGVRGVGETSIVPPLAAINNAVSRATGIRFTELPLSPPKVLKAILNNH